MPRDSACSLVRMDVGMATMSFSSPDFIFWPRRSTVIFELGFVGVRLGGGVRWAVGTCCVLIQFSWGRLIVDWPAARPRTDRPVHQSTGSPHLHNLPLHHICMHARTREGGRGAGAEADDHAGGDVVVHGLVPHLMSVLGLVS